jgi:hypothetical protein
VWVYGIVLPNLEDRKGRKKRNRDLPEMIAGAGSSSSLPAIPGLLRPPALVAGGTASVAQGAADEQAGLVVNRPVAVLFDIAFC